MDLTEHSPENSYRHPWELSRCQSLLGLLPSMPRSCIYGDIGAGDQFIAQKLLQQTEGLIHTVDTHPGKWSAIDARLIPHQSLDEIQTESLDVLLLLDVLEHVEQDGDFLKRALRLLKPGGHVFITVPAHPCLFSRHDVLLHHFRRYSRKDVLRLVQQAGLETQECFFFYTGLFILRGLEVAASFFIPSKAQSTATGRWPLAERHPLTRFLVILLNLDFQINRLLARGHVIIPGLSLCLVGIKP